MSFFTDNHYVSKAFKEVWFALSCVCVTFSGDPGEVSEPRTQSQLKP